MIKRRIFFSLVAPGVLFLLMIFSVSSTCNDSGTIDLELNSTEISFSNEKPIETEQITINANVTNKNDKEVLNARVQFLDDLVRIGNVSLNISCNSTIAASLNWTTQIGPNNITVILDPENSISELNESNNNATQNSTIAAHSFFWGNVFASRIILGSGGSSLFNLSGTSTHVLAVDSDSAVDFSSLQSLGRKKDGTASSDDFSELDTILNMSLFNDSMTTLYGINGSSPKQTIALRIEDQDLSNIPFVNSTNTSSFITGILWDKSDDSNGEYDSTEKEDIVFIANINLSQKGGYGTYDYEIRVPALLRSYKGIKSTVDFFLDVR